MAMMRQSVVNCDDGGKENGKRRLTIIIIMISLFQVSSRHPPGTPSPQRCLAPAPARDLSQTMTAAVTLTSAPGRAGTRTR